MNTRKHQEVEKVSTRVKRTKQEIEQLKNDFEKLISSGIQQTTLTTIPKSSTHVTIPEPKPVEIHKPSISRTVNIQPSDPQLKKRVSATQKKTETTKTSPTKKIRHYNVADAREYIKKQREQRAEHLKTQLNHADNALDLKRQKLRELHQKTLELVTKNVQQKRERSQSKDREPPIRLDKSNPRVKNIRSKSQEPQKQETTTRLRETEKQKPPTRSKSQEIVQSYKQVKPVIRLTRPSRSRSPERIQKTDKKYLCPPDADVHANMEVTDEVERHSSLEDNAWGPLNLIKSSCEDVNSKLNTSFSQEKDHIVNLAKNVTCRHKIQKKVLEHSIATDACLKDTKETQTNRFEGVSWMQPPPVLASPYNFINTVKRKLQNAINSPRSHVDIGVQHSFSETPEVAKAKTREELKELIIKSTKSDLHSFASHRGPNLDLRVVENLELVPNKSQSIKDVSRKLFTYNSDSDTSKNIPDISSESLSTAKSKPQLNLDKLKDMKLQKLPKSSENSYSSDFQIESPKSGSTTIRTVVSEKQIQELRVSPQATSSVSTHTTSSNKSSKPSTSKQTNLLNFVNTDSRGGGDSTFKNLSTKSQTSSPWTERISKSLVLTEPSVSLNVRKDNTITIRTPTGQISIQNSASGEDSRGTFKSLLNGDKTSRSSSESIPEHFGPDRSSRNVSTNGTGGSNSILENLDASGSHRNISPSRIDNSVSLREPTVSLVLGREDKRDDLIKSQMKNITLRPTASSNNVNEIHLKFEAEVRLLNDFNESFKQFMAVEKAYQNLKNKNENNLGTRKILQNVDTQTSFLTKSSTNISSEKSTRDRNSSVNFSRGSEIMEELNDSFVNNNRNSSKSHLSSSLSTDWNLSNLNESSIANVSTGEEAQSRISMSDIENCNVKNRASILSLNMFDQLIKDEDARIKHLKVIIKIREQALLDRTKGELVWLEIQKKQLIETGKIEEASLLKKKQRGIILKHEQERNEIKKLKQMQKEQSERRKNTLKQQRNLIKTQLSTDDMLSKITVKKSKERRSMGPLRVMQSCSESIHSETSISLKSSATEDVLTISSKSLRLSEGSELDLSRGLKDEEVPVSIARRALLMREAALQKRRKAAEELLQWHGKLLDEERKISELEAATTSVVKQVPEGRKDKYKFNGKQLNQLWRNMTGSDEGKFVEDKLYVMSQIALERLCKSARQYSNKSKKTKNSEQSNSGVSDTERPAKKSSDDANYSSAFEPESVQEIINSQEEKTKISSISELIDNFNRIEDEISTLSKKSENIVLLEEDFDKSSQSPKTMTPNHVAEPVEEDEELSEKTSSIKEVEEQGDESSINETKQESSVKLSPKDISIPSEDMPSVEQIEDQEEEKSNLPTATEDYERISTQKEDLETPKSSQDISSEVEEQIVATDTEASSRQDLEVIDEQIALQEDPEKITDETVYKRIPSPPYHVNEHTVEELEEARSDEISIEDKSESVKTIEQQDKPKTPEEYTTISTDEEEQVSVKILEDQEEEPTKTPEEGMIIGTEEEEERASITTIEDKEEPTKSPEERTIAIEEEEEASVKTIEHKEEPAKSLEELRVTTGEEEQVTETSSGKELLSLEEALESAFKIEESLSKLNEKFNKSEEDVSLPTSTGKEVESLEEVSSKIGSSSVNVITEEKTPQKKSPNQIDVKKRVSEILADASPSRGDKSPRLQDLYVTAYDVGATNSTEINENYDEGRQLPTDIFGSEAEELWRKQLAIEQEIKQIELQQKEQLPYMFMREIPNKPPPPYTPPSSLSSLPQSILPSDVKEISEVASYSSKVLYKAYQNNNLDKVKFSENGFKLFTKAEVTKICAEYIFNICRDIAKNHYKQFEIIEEPSWLAFTKKSQLARTSPPDAIGLEKLLNERLKELFGFKKVRVAESAIIKWGRKKRDHVDDVLVIESQEEECQWTNFDQDELVVKNQVTEDMANMLLQETATVFAKILSKKKAVVGVDSV